jgi:hypothetical protein
MMMKKRLTMQLKLRAAAMIRMTRKTSHQTLMQMRMKIMRTKMKIFLMTLNFWTCGWRAGEVSFASPTAARRSRWSLSRIRAFARLKTL